MPNVFQWSEFQIYAFFFTLVRISALMVFLPIFGDRAVPGPVKILFGLSLSIVVFPLMWAKGVRLDPRIMESTASTVWALACDVGFGMMLGFVSRWIFDAVQFGAHFASTNIGFSMASVFDPHTEAQSTALTEIHYVLAAMLFLAMNGHHMLIGTIIESFKIVPLGGANILANGDGVAQYLIQMTAEVIGLGLKLAAPVMVVLLLMNLTFGMMARAVPQMNVLAVSFSMNILMGLFIVLVSMPSFVNMVSTTFDVYTPNMIRFMRLFQ